MAEFVEGAKTPASASIFVRQATGLVRTLYCCDATFRRGLCMGQSHIASIDWLWSELLRNVHTAFKRWIKQFVDGNMVLASCLSYCGMGCRGPI